MNGHAFVTAGILAPVIGSPQREVWLALPVDSNDRVGSHGVQPNGIPASGLTVATVALPDGIVLGR
jgi:hypothetical protein